jgi:DsbC/DsbD-like thiol-disulfide interchange protein
MKLIVPFRHSLALVVAIAACAMPSLSHAQDASPWIEDLHSSVRLIAGSRSGNVLLGGIGFQLQPGWKTYWRAPGDSGVPPRIDFSKSDNVESVTILWPAPAKFPDGNGGISLGYQKQVTLPLRIHVKSADRPVTLRAKIDYAVCEKLCLPVEANAELAFSSSASTADSAIAAALDTVPKPAKIGDDNPLTIRDVRRDGKIGVIVDVVTPDGKDADLFAEGPTPDWALPVPKLIKREASGVQRFSFDLDGLPPGASPDNAALKLTLAGANTAYEFNVNLK